MNKKKLVLYALTFAFFVLSICGVYVYNKNFKVENVELVYYSEDSENIVFLIDTDNLISSDTSVLTSKLDPAVLKSKMGLNYIKILKENILMPKGQLVLGDVVNVEVKGDLFRKKPAILNSYKYRILNKKENLIELHQIDAYILDISENNILVAKNVDLETIDYLNGLTDSQLTESFKKLNFDMPISLGYFSFENPSLIDGLYIRQTVKIKTNGIEMESYPTQGEAVDIVVE